jgi:hypothetical protein
MARPSVRAAYVSIVAIIVNPNNPQADDQLRELLDAAHTVGVQVEPFKGSSPSDTAFATIAERRAGGLLMAADAFFNTREEQSCFQRGTHFLRPFLTGSSLRPVA